LVSITPPCLAGVIPPRATLDFYVRLVGWEPERRWCLHW
jgi:hypothetical protein